MVRSSEVPLGPAIRRRRQELGFTQSDLAASANIADETVSRIERGRLVPSVTIAERIATALDTNLDALRERKRSPASAPRPSEARLLALVRDLDDTAVDDLARALKVMLQVGAKRGRR
jgi:transcriptional regulator with XRE-family HTH domain